MPIRSEGMISSRLANWFISPDITSTSSQLKKWSIVILTNFEFGKFLKNFRHDESELVILNARTATLFQWEDYVCQNDKF
jgi:hypothetical protein